MLKLKLMKMISPTHSGFIFIIVILLSNFECVILNKNEFEKLMLEKNFMVKI